VNQESEGQWQGVPETDGSKAEKRAREQTVSWPIRRFDRSGCSSELSDIVVREQRIELVLNDIPVLAMLALPRDVQALALGFLASEGLWLDRGRLPDVSFDSAKGELRCVGAFDEAAIEGIHRRWTFGTGCGGGGTGRDPSRLSDCQPIISTMSVRASRLSILGKEFARRTVLFHLTGGVHACALADDKELLLVAEDVGRHNAFDKVAGMALLEGRDLSQSIVLSTGRLSAEIVAKAIAHGIPVLVSFSAPTAMGVRWAGRFGLTLVGFLRGKRMNVYTGYQRVLSDDAAEDVPTDA